MKEENTCDEINLCNECPHEPFLCRIGLHVWEETSRTDWFVDYVCKKCDKWIRESAD